MHPTQIRPLDLKHGVGFMASEPLENPKGYRYEQVGRYHNYHCTAESWRWPQDDWYIPTGLVIDAFSPNLNKELHVGHLRNLALAHAFQNMFCGDRDNCMVSLYGASLGVKKAALDGLRDWKLFLGYKPIESYDVLMPDDVIVTRPVTQADIDGWVAEKQIGDDRLEYFPNLTLENNSTEVWDGPNGPVIVKRSDGRKLYAYYDVVFAERMKPTHYLTGHEQRDHFEKLGLGDRHLPMGLVLGPDGKKLRSRDGNALKANEAVDLVIERLDKTPYPKKVAWNILAWNFLRTSRSKDVKFDVEKWCDPDSPGLYITYTYARIKKALKAAMVTGWKSDRMFLLGMELDDLRAELTAEDVRLVGFASQVYHWQEKAAKEFDPASFANFTHDLARTLGAAYAREKIVGGRSAFLVVIRYVLAVLDQCMFHLGMFDLDEV